MRFAVLLALASSLAVSTPALALGDRAPDARQIAQLEARALAAPPREQPWLYAQLVHSMTDLATAQYRAGNVSEASASLLRARTYALRIHRTLLRDAKRLRQAEILIRHTAFRLRQLLMGGVGNRATVEATMLQLNQLQAEMLHQEFQP